MQPMNDLIASAFRLSRVLGLGALSSVLAGAATLTLITGSANPWSWLAAYQHVQECAHATATVDPNCVAAHVAPAADVNPAQASPAPPAEPTSEPPAPTAPPAAAPNPPTTRTAAPAYESDDTTSDDGSDS